MTENKEESMRKILSWAEADRPREKLLLKGRTALTDAELIAILIGSGTVEMSAVDVGKAILQKAANNLHELAKLSIKDLTKIKGIGEAKAITIVAALELGRRRKDSEPTKRTRVTSSVQAYDYMKSYLIDLPHEEFWILLLNRANDVIRPLQISQGGVVGTVVDAKVVFRYAIEHLASSMILFHNHPSGHLTPSDADRTLTKKLKESGKLIDIQVLDHIIVGDTAYFSFGDESLM
jgi:DNA repair protein RadC